MGKTDFLIVLIVCMFFPGLIPIVIILLLLGIFD